MTKEIIKTALQHPETLKDVLESGLVEGKELQKLKRVYSEYLKNKKMPSDEMLKTLFKVDLKEENETDRELIYQILHEFNVERYIEEVQNLLYQSSAELSIEKIHEVGKRYLKSYGGKAENRFLLSSPDDVKELKKRIEAKETHFLKTGFSSINGLTKGSSADNSGGWHPGALYSIMGLSGYGKSIFLTNFARDIWERGNNVLYISTEMDQEETFERIIKSKYKSRNLDEVLLKMEGQPFPSSKIEVIKVHPNDTSCDDIQILIDNLDWKPEVLVIDYADELKSHEKTSSEYEAQGVVYAGLKKLAEINNLPIITATQTNRAAEDGENGGTKKWVGMSAIADSSKKIRLVDMLFSITQSTNDKVGNILNLLVLKNRFGQSNTKISFTINYQTMRLEELSQPTTTSPVKVSTPTKEVINMFPAEKVLMGVNNE
jgi:replicative DNA helicase